MDIIKSFFYFLLAGLFELGGGYLIWIWIRDNRTIWYGVLGGVLLVLYGIIPTLQPDNFGRVYAAYGGIFIFLAMLWGWRVDKIAPDRYDLIGVTICLIGVFIITILRKRLKVVYPRTITTIDRIIIASIISYLINFLNLHF